MEGSSDSSFVSSSDSVSNASSAPVFLGVTTPNKNAAEPTYDPSQPTILEVFNGTPGKSPTGAKTPSPPPTQVTNSTTSKHSSKKKAAKRKSKQTKNKLPSGACKS